MSSSSITLKDCAQVALCVTIGAAAGSLFTQAERLYRQRLEQRREEERRRVAAQLANAEQLLTHLETALLLFGDVYPVLRVVGTELRRNRADVIELIVLCTAPKNQQRSNPKAFSIVLERLVSNLIPAIICSWFATATTRTRPQPFSFFSVPTAGRSGNNGGKSSTNSGSNGGTNSSSGTNGSSGANVDPYDVVNAAVVGAADPTPNNTTTATPDAPAAAASSSRATNNDSTAFLNGVMQLVNRVVSDSPSRGAATSEEDASLESSNVQASLASLVNLLTAPPQSGSNATGTTDTARASPVAPVPMPSPAAAAAAVAAAANAGTSSRTSATVPSGEARTSGSSDSTTTTTNAAAASASAAPLSVGDFIRSVTSAARLSAASQTAPRAESTVVTPGGGAEKKGTSATVKPTTVPIPAASSSSDTPTDYTVVPRT